MHHFRNGDVYEGEFFSDKRVGKGKMTFRDTSKLISQFIDDQADGHGIYEDCFGNSFQSAVAEEGVAETGAFRNGRLYDMGKVHFSNEDKYKGHFNDGRPSKHGEIKYHLSIVSPSGELEGGEYLGNFKNGKRHGRGVMKWEDGSIFEGEWASDERVHGLMRMTNGFVRLFLRLKVNLDLHWSLQKRQT